MRVFTEQELHEILTKTADRSAKRLGKGAYTRGWVDAIQAIIAGMELKAGAQTHIIRGE